MSSMDAGLTPSRCPTPVIQTLLDLKLNCRLTNQSTLPSSSITHQIAPTSDYGSSHGIQCGSSGDAHDDRSMGEMMWVDWSDSDDCTQIDDENGRGGSGEATGDNTHNHPSNASAALDPLDYYRLHSTITDLQQTIHAQTQSYQSQLQQFQEETKEWKERVEADKQLEHDTWQQRHNQQVRRIDELERRLQEQMNQQRQKEEHHSTWQAAHQQLELNHTQLKDEVNQYHQQLQERDTRQQATEQEIASLKQKQTELQAELNQLSQQQSTLFDLPQQFDSHVDHTRAEWNSMRAKLNDVEEKNEEFDRRLVTLQEHIKKGLVAPLPTIPFQQSTLQMDLASHQRVQQEFNGTNELSSAALVEYESGKTANSTPVASTSTTLEDTSSTVLVSIKPIDGGSSQVQVQSSLQSCPAQEDSKRDELLDQAAAAVVTASDSLQVASPSPIVTVEDITDLDAMDTTGSGTLLLDDLRQLTHQDEDDEEEDPQPPPAEVDSTNQTIQEEEQSDQDDTSMETDDTFASMAVQPPQRRRRAQGHSQTSGSSTETTSTIRTVKLHQKENESSTATAVEGTSSEAAALNKGLANQLFLFLQTPPISSQESNLLKKEFQNLLDWKSRPKEVVQWLDSLRDDNGWPIIMCAINHRSILKWLWFIGVSLETSSDRVNGDLPAASTILHLAFQRNLVRTVQWLLDVKEISVQCFFKSNAAKKIAMDLLPPSSNGIILAVKAFRQRHLEEWTTMQKELKQKIESISSTDSSSDSSPMTPAASHGKRARDEAEKDDQQPPSEPSTPSDSATLTPPSKRMKMTHASPARTRTQRLQVESRLGRPVGLSELGDNTIVGVTQTDELSSPPVASIKKRPSAKSTPTKVTEPDPFDFETFLKQSEQKSTPQVRVKVKQSAASKSKSTHPVKKATKKKTKHATVHQSTVTDTVMAEALIHEQSNSTSHLPSSSIPTKAESPIPILPSPPQRRNVGGRLFTDLPTFDEKGYLETIQKIQPPPSVSPKPSKFEMVDEEDEEDESLPQSKRGRKKLSLGAFSQAPGSASSFSAIRTKRINSTQPRGEEEMNDDPFA